VSYQEARLANWPSLFGVGCFIAPVEHFGFASAPLDCSFGCCCGGWDAGITECDRAMRISRDSLIEFAATCGGGAAFAAGQAFALFSR